jgi:hypothetical protein
MDEVNVRREAWGLVPAFILPQSVFIERTKPTAQQWGVPLYQCDSYRLVTIVYAEVVPPRGISTTKAGNTVYFN